MSIGFIYLKSSYGQLIRIKAIKQYLIKNGINILDLEFENYTQNKISRITNYILRNNLLKSYDKSLSFIDNITISERFLTKRSLLTKFIDSLSLEKYADIKYFHAENHEGAFLAFLLKEKLGIPYVFDMHGLAYEEALGNKLNSTECEFVRKLEQVTVENAAYISVVSKYMKDYLHEKYNYPLENILIIPCGSKIYCKTAQYSKTPNVIYAGGLGYWESIMDYVNMPIFYKKKYKKNDAKFYFLGGGNKMNDILKYINMNDINLTYLGSKTREETLETLCKMQVGVIPSTKDIARICASPVKVVDYASCGLPIITCDVGEWTDIIKEYDAGVVCKNSDPNEFAEAVSILKDKTIWEHKSRNAVTMVNEKYDWDIVLKPLLELYS